MRSKHSSTFVVALVAASSVALLGASANAAPKGCDVPPFSFGTVPADVSNGPKGILAEWTSTRSAVELQCASGIVTVDVWEHAIIGLHEDENQDGDFDDRGERKVRGRAQIVIEFTGAGIEVPFEGTLRGVRDTSSSPGPFGFEIDSLSSSSQGAKLRLEQSGQLDLVNETLDLDVVQGFIGAGGSIAG
jgi:hypothetical protein